MTRHFAGPSWRTFLGCDGDRGGVCVGVDALDQLVLRQVGERFVQVVAADVGSGEVGGGRGEEKGRVAGLLVAGGVEQPPLEGVHGVAEPGGAVSLELLQPVDPGAAPVGEVTWGVPPMVCATRTRSRSAVLTHG